MKKLIYCFAALSLLFACNPAENGPVNNQPDNSGKDSDKDKDKENVISSVTVEAKHVSAISALLMGEANVATASASDLKVGFQYSKSAGILPQNSVSVDAEETDADYNYSTSITGLEPDTKYYFRSFVLHNGQYAYGETQEFTTKGVASMFETKDASAIGAENASLSARLDLTYVLYENLAYGFLLGTSESDLNTDIQCTELKNNAFTASLADLAYETQYWYKAYVKLDSQTFYGEVKTFTTGYVPVESVSLDMTSLSLQAGEEATLSVTFHPDNASDKSLSWSSSDNTIASVDNSGKVTAKAKGKVTISVTANALSSANASCSLIVSPKCPDGAVDMGLTTPDGYKLYWATCNIGANNPEDYGDYYAWGETETDSQYNWSTYMWSFGSMTTITKYNNNMDYGPVMDHIEVLRLGQNQGETVDDVARAKLGGEWRMPTDAEWTELRTKCTWTWTEQNGVNGRLVSASNGNSIFLPAAGYKDNAQLKEAGSHGSYWSSSVDTDYPYFAWFVYFDSETKKRNQHFRYAGFSVRPVSE